MSVYRGPSPLVQQAGGSATVTVGTTTTGAPGTSASVTNSGTPSAAVLDFTIPRGAAGVGGGGSTAPPTSATVEHLQPGGVTRYLSAVLNDRYVSVKSFGALGNDIADDTTAIQACFDYCIANGRTAFFPSGTYLITAGLTVSNGTLWNQFSSRMAIQGSGAGNTRIRMASGNFTMITWGLGTGAERHISIRGLYLEGPAVIDKVNTGWISGGGTSKGLSLAGLSYSVIDEVTISGFGIGLYVYDTLNTHFSNCYINSCVYGVQLFRGNFTGPNAITFTACKIAGNANYGMNADGVQMLTIVGGSIEGNGWAGADANKFGLNIVTGSDGCCAFNISGSYLEGNKGLADLLIRGTFSSAGSITGCTFNRFDAVNYATNCIAMSAAPGIKLDVSITGCGFGAFNTYAPSSSRRVIENTGGTVNVGWIGCYFANAVEAPSIPNTATKGLLVSTITKPQIVGGNDNSGDVVTITYTLPFAAPPNVLVQATQSGGASVIFAPEIYGVTATQFSLQKKRMQAVGPTIDTSNYAVTWVATGQAV